MALVNLNDLIFGLIFNQNHDFWLQDDNVP